MSDFTEKKPENSMKDTFKRNNSSSIENFEISELIKIQYVKELLMKVDILKNGIISERKKSKNYEIQIKKLEEELNAKNEEIKGLGDKEETKKIKNNEKDILLLKSKEEINKLREEITKIKTENENIKKRENLEFVKKKLEFEKTLNEQNGKINQLQNEIEKLKEDKSNLEEKLREKLIEYNKYLKEKEHLNLLVKEYKNNREEAIHEMNACLEKCRKLLEDNRDLKDSLSIHQKDAKILADKLAKYKNKLIKVNLRNQMFHVIKVGKVSKNDIDIYFGQDKNDNYVMRIDEKDKIELINILDVDYIKQVDTNNKNKVQISYVSNRKRILINVIVDDYIIDEFIEAYTNFYSESVKIQNKLVY